MKGVKEINHHLDEISYLRIITSDLSFNGYLNIEGFLDWNYEVKNLFKVMDIPDYKQVKLVAYKLKRGIAA